jgi:hypothetical protein
MKKLIAFMILTLLPYTTTQAALIQMDFSVTGFVATNGAIVPDNTVSGSISWIADNIHADVQEIIDIGLSIQGYDYQLPDLAFENNLFGIPWNIMGAEGTANGIALAFNDFHILWDSVSLMPVDFMYSTLGVNDTFWASNYSSFSISEVSASISEPTTIVILFLALSILFFRRVA